MQKIFRQLLVGLTGVCFLNAGILIVAARGNVNSGIAIAGDKAFENLWHPVLDLGPQDPSFRAPRNFSLPDVLVGSEAWPDQPTLKKTLDDASFRKMINLTIPNGSRKAWGEAFGRIEGEAALQLCHRLKGLHQGEIVHLLGPPASMAGSPLCLPRRPNPSEGNPFVFANPRVSEDLYRNMDDNWLYFFGGEPELIRVIFSHGLCTAATTENFEFDTLYNSWRADQLQGMAAGKTTEEIIAFEGAGYAGCISPDKDTVLTSALNRVKGHSTLAEILPSADKILKYQFGTYHSLLLVIKNDRCIYVGPDPGPWELRAGEPPWSHRPSEAPFRMPHSGPETRVEGGR